jgi:tetratricopeptide (TPR) repeat protein
MKNIFYGLKNIFLKEVPIQKDKKKELSQEEKEKSLYELIHNPPQSVEKVFEYLNSEDFNRSKNSMIELNNSYYRNRDTVSKEMAEKRTWFQNQVLVEYGFNVSATLKSAFDYGDRAIAKAELNDPLGAIEDFDKAIQLNSEYENAYVWRGEEKYKISDYQGAISDYQLALKLNPDNSEVFLNLGKAKLKLGKLDEALSDLKKATTLGNKKSEQ